MILGKDNTSKSSVISQKSAFKTGITRKQRTLNFRKKKHFLPPDMHMYVCVSGRKKFSFFSKFGVLCLLVTPVLIFALLLYYIPILSGNLPGQLHKTVHVRHADFSRNWKTLVRFYRVTYAFRVHTLNNDLNFKELLVQRRCDIWLQLYFR